MRSLTHNSILVYQVEHEFMLARYDVEYEINVVDWIRVLFDGWRFQELYHARIIVLLA